MHYSVNLPQPESSQSQVQEVARDNSLVVFLRDDCVIELNVVSYHPRPARTTF